MLFIVSLPDYAQVGMCYDIIAPILSAYGLLEHFMLENSATHHLIYFWGDG